MRYISVCSGIEAASVAWKPLGWTPVAFSEIDPDACLVLSHRFPGVPNLGDMTKITDEQLKRLGPIDVVIGGTPCQSFSKAGLRGGLTDPRGQLALRFIEIIKTVRPRWVVWENVVGVLSSDNGRDFGAFVGALGKLGYGFSYRVLDAKNFGVPQQRRRVYLVGHFGDWRHAARVLFEPESLQGHYEPNCSKKSSTPQSSLEDSKIDSGNWWSGVKVAPTLDAVLCKQQSLPEKNRFPAVIVDNPVWSLRPDITPKVKKDIMLTLVRDPSGGVGAVTENQTLRRITPREAERLQGLPDDWTLVPKKNGFLRKTPRYKLIGNSMAVPVVRWVGRRIEIVDKSLTDA